MFKVKDKNLKIVGFYGQSGAGKTTVIRNVPDLVGGKSIIKNTGTIRYLFTKNPDSYRNPMEFISQKDAVMADKNPGAQIAHIYERYIRSQFQLMNDFSTEVFLSAREDYAVPSVMMFDRCPMDFNSITECGMEQLRSEFGGKLNKIHSSFMALEKKAAIENTVKFFDAIFIVKPWVAPDSKQSSTLKDGVRDQYLSEHYVDANWYSKLDGIDLGTTKVFVIDENVISKQGIVFEIRFIY